MTFMAESAQHYGKGNKAFSDRELEDFLLDSDLAKTSELAEEFGVSNTAIRNRADAHGRVESRKIRNRRVWYVPHDMVVESDGGGYLGGFPIGGLAPVAEAFVWAFCAVATLAIFARLLLSWFPLWPVFVALLLAVLCANAARRYEDKADPTLDLSDIERQLEGRQ